MEALLEAERQGKLDRSGKGNSLFSEVEDRREKVEVQLKVFEEKFSLLKENYDGKLRELQKTKLHNAQLLGLVGGRGGGEEHSARLEELLEVERERNRQLSERLDSLENCGMVGQAVVEEQVPIVLAGNKEEGGQQQRLVWFRAWHFLPRPNGQTPDGLRTNDDVSTLLCAWLCLK